MLKKHLIIAFFFIFSPHDSFASYRRHGAGMPPGMAGDWTIEALRCDKSYSLAPDSELKKSGSTKRKKRYGSDDDTAATMTMTEFYSDDDKDEDSKETYLDTEFTQEILKMAPQSVHDFIDLVKVRDARSINLFQRAPEISNVQIFMAPEGMGATRLAEATATMLKLPYRKIFSNDCQAVLNELSNLQKNRPQIVILKKLNLALKKKKDAELVWHFLENSNYMNNVLFIAIVNELNTMPRQIKNRMKKCIHKVKTLDDKKRKRIIEYCIKRYFGSYPEDLNIGVLVQKTAQFTIRELDAMVRIGLYNARARYNKHFTENVGEKEENILPRDYDFKRAIKTIKHKDQRWHKSRDIDHVTLKESVNVIPQLPMGNVLGQKQASKTPIIPLNHPWYVTAYIKYMPYIQYAAVYLITPVAFQVGFNYLLSKGCFSKLPTFNQLCSLLRVYPKII